LTNFLVFGNTGRGVLANSAVLNMKDSIVCGDSTVAQPYGIQTQHGSLQRFNLDNVDMNPGTGIYVVNSTADFYFNTSATRAHPEGYMNYCRFGSPTLILNKTTWSKNAFMSFQSFNRTAGLDFTEMRHGKISRDDSVYETAAPSIKMTPSSLAVRLESAPVRWGRLFSIDSGQTLDVSVDVRNMTNALPRLVLRRNNSIGVTDDTVLDTGSATALTTPTFESGTATAVTLSNGDLTVTSGGTTSANQGAHVEFSRAQSTGKFYFEALIVDPGGASSNVAVGLGTTSAVYSTLGPNATNGIMYYNGTGNVWGNGSSLGASSISASTGNYVCVAVDLDSRKMWLRRDATGAWNGNSAHNPATGVGGFTIPAGSMVPFVTFGGTGASASDAYTLNFGGTSFVGAVPEGFLPGWLTGTPTWETLSGTTPAATADGMVELIVDCLGYGILHLDEWDAAA
jgi:hypothetical protein